MPTTADSKAGSTSFAALQPATWKITWAGFVPSTASMATVQAPLSGSKWPLAGQLKHMICEKSLFLLIRSNTFERNHQARSGSASSSSSTAVSLAPAISASAALCGSSAMRHLTKKSIVDSLIFWPGIFRSSNPAPLSIRHAILKRLQDIIVNITSFALSVCPVSSFLPPTR